MVTEYVKKEILTFCGTGKFIIHPHTIFLLTSISLLPSHLHLGFPTGLFLSCFLSKTLYTIPTYHADYSPCSSHPPWSDFPDNVWWRVKLIKLLFTGPHILLSTLSPYAHNPYSSKFHTRIKYEIKLQSCTFEHKVFRSLLCRAVTIALMHPWVADGDSHQICRVAVNSLNNLSQIANKGWASTLHHELYETST